MVMRCSRGKYGRSRLAFPSCCLVGEEDVAVNISRRGTLHLSPSTCLLNRERCSRDKSRGSLFNRYTSVPCSRNSVWLSSSPSMFIVIPPIQYIAVSGMDNERSVAGARQSSLSRVIKANHKTLAAKFNRRMYNELRRVLQNDPEADLTGFLSDSYSQRLKSYKGKYHICICGQSDANEGVI